MNCFTDGKYCPHRPKTTEGEEAYTPIFFYGSQSQKANDAQLHKLNENTDDRTILFDLLRDKCLYQQILEQNYFFKIEDWFNY